MNKKERSELGRLLASLRKNPGRKVEHCEDPKVAERRTKAREYMRAYRAGKKQEK